MLAQKEKNELELFLKDALKFDEISNIETLKRGMTNKSFTFTSQGKKYILRIPGKGTDKLINRHQESEVYKTIAGKDLCDNIIYFDEENGRKVTEFIEDSHNCNPDDLEDLNKCFKKLKELHHMGLKVDHEFNLIKKIEYYESLMGCTSQYANYSEVKSRVFSLQEFVDSQKKDYVLTHIDAVCDNFLVKGDSITLIDWEYAAMQDPHVDIAMFAVYSMYNREQTDRIIDIYFENKCNRETRLKVYSYVAMCGLLWSNWCEYKKKLGVDFGEYALAQYRFAEEYSELVLSSLEK